MSHPLSSLGPLSRTRGVLPMRASVSEVVCMAFRYARPPLADNQSSLGPSQAGHAVLDHKRRTPVEGGMIGTDRKSGREGKSVSVRVDLGGSRIIKKKKQTKTSKITDLHRMTKSLK